MSCSMNAFEVRNVSGFYKERLLIEREIGKVGEGSRD